MAYKMVRYHKEDSPNHLNKPAMFMQQLRASRDFSSCDMAMTLCDGSSERLHYVIAAAHSDRLAKTMAGLSAPYQLNMTAFRAKTVRSVVDWMYRGEADLWLGDISNHLKVSHYLGLVYLHRQLEQTVRKMVSAEGGGAVAALNIATCGQTGISSETVHCIVTMIANELVVVNEEDIVDLNVHSIIALVSAQVSQQQKAHLLSITLGWLRFPVNICHLDYIIKSISVPDLTSLELNAFKKTLTTALRNPSTRQMVAIELKRNRIDITMHPREMMENNSRSSGSDLNTCGASSIALSEKFCRSPAPNPYEYEAMYEIPVLHRRDRKLKGYPSSFDSNEQAEMDDLYRSQRFHVYRGEAMASPSLIGDLNALPPTEQVFAYDRQRPMAIRSFTPSEQQEIRDLPDVFRYGSSSGGGYGRSAGGIVSQPGSRNGNGSPEDSRHDNAVRGVRSFTRSEIGEIAQLPVSFGSNMSPVGRRRGPIISETDVELINGTRESSSPPPRFYTLSEIENLRTIPTQFNSNRNVGVRPQYREQLGYYSSNPVSVTGSTTSTVADVTSDRRDPHLMTHGKKDRPASEISEIRRLEAFSPATAPSKSDIALSPSAQNSEYACCQPKTTLGSSYYAI